MADRAFTDADLDAAIAALSEPGRLRAAQDLVARAAPALHRVLDEAIDEGGWFDSAHEQALREAASEADPGLRAQAVRTLVSEETRLGMFVGVTVGFELARELGHASPPGEPPPASPLNESQRASGPNEPPPASPLNESQRASGPNEPPPANPPHQSPPTNEEE